MDRILTSGQECSALEGLDLLAALVAKAGDRIVVMPGCGITPRNIRRIATGSGAKEIHIVANRTVTSPMTHRNSRVYMGTELRSPEYTREVTSAAGVAEFVEGGVRTKRPLFAGEAFLVSRVSNE